MNNLHILLSMTYFPLATMMGRQVDTDARTPNVFTLSFISTLWLTHINQLSKIMQQDIFWKEINFWRKKHCKVNFCEFIVVFVAPKFWIIKVKIGTSVSFFNSTSNEDLATSIILNQAERKHYCDNNFLRSFQCSLC